MSQIANRTLNTQTFVASSPQVGTSPARWYQKAAGQLNGYKKVEQLLSQNNQAATTKTRTTLYVPVLDADGNIARHCTAVLTVTTSHQSTTAEKQDVADILASMVADTVFTTSITSDEVVY